MGSSDIYKNNFKNIKKYVDDLYYKIATGFMKRSTYDRNNDGKVDISESVSLDQKPSSVTETEIKFGVDEDGKWGYIKGGADTVTPFKGDPNLQTKSVYPYGGSSTDSIVVTQNPQTEYPSGNPLDLGNVRIGKPLSPYEVMADEGYDGLYLVTIQPPELQSKTVNPTKNQQTIGPDTGYVALGSVTVNAYPDPTLQSKTASASTSVQTITADSGYDGLSQVTVNAISLQSKTASSSTSVQTITPDSGYDGLSEVEISAIPSQGMFEYAFPDRVIPTAITTNGRYSYSAQTAYNTQTEGYYEGYSLSSGGITIDVNVPTATLQSNKTVTPSASQQIVTPDSGYDGLEQVTVNAVSLQSKTATPSTSQQVITPDSGYTALSKVTVNAVSLQSKTATPSTSQQVIIPDSGYTALSKVTVNAVSLQSKSVTGMTPSANWSGAYTNSYSISTDSGYTGMSSVSVTVPMIRDYSLFTVSTVETPSTVYNGDTAQSNSTKMLRIAPTKTGMVYTNSYLELGPSSYMGNATAADVLSGKTFSSSNGIQLTGTNPGGSTPSGNINLGTITTNGSKTGYNVSGYATCSFTVSVPTGGSLESNKYTESLWKGSKEVLPSSGYDAMSKIKIYGIKLSTTLIWENINGTGDNFGAQTITLSQSYKNFSAILIEYWPNKNAGSSVEYLNWIMGTDEIAIMNNTSTNSFIFAGKAVTSPGASSGTMYARYFRFPTETTMYITTANQCGGTGSSSGVLIPTFIYGIP